MTCAERLSWLGHDILRSNSIAKEVLNRQLLRKKASGRPKPGLITLGAEKHTENSY